MSEGSKNVVVDGAVVLAHAAKFHVECVAAGVDGSDMNDGLRKNLMRLLEVLITTSFSSIIGRLRMVGSALAWGHDEIPLLTKSQLQRVCEHCSPGLGNRTLLHAVLLPTNWDLLRAYIRNAIRTDGAKVDDSYRKALGEQPAAVTAAQD
jgi:hypothetical protein